MYESPLYRPPSEAYSLILQLTSGCSYNKCTFCDMYKDKPFRVKSEDEIDAHIIWAKSFDRTPKKIFLADGNFLCLSTERVLNILNKVKQNFPSAARISSYAGPLDILGKSDDELFSIRKAGLELLYIGIESGSDQVLKAVNKGVDSAEMIQAGRKAKKAGFTISCMLISGLGGQKLLGEHAKESGRVISEINPDYMSMLTLMIPEDSKLEQQVKAGEFTPLSPEQVMLELRLLLLATNLENCEFRANHASNYLNLNGILDRDKEKFLRMIDAAAKSEHFKPEWLRGL